MHQKNIIMKLSVLIPNLGYTENVKFLLEKLDKNKTDEFTFEVIIFDQSDDDDFKLINEMVKSFEFCTLVRSSVKSISNARLQLLKLAKGEYVVFIDSDDMISDNYLKKIYSSLKINSFPDILLVNYQDCVQNKKPVLNNVKVGDDYESIYEQFMYGGQFASMWRKIFRKDLFNDFDKIDTSIQYGEDWLLSYYIFNNSKTIFL